ncbi:exonuclease 1-like isoform X2 [Typha latifolia]|uniref:exonuclease 1-like isoform X2 n=1 Tax=Typha latifolia TaxID=4733 RepID=UPI003C2C16CF
MDLFFSAPAPGISTIKKKRSKKELQNICISRDMGIQNLLRFMKPFIDPVHIKKYAGERVGIDAYSWLHKGAYSCSMELCLNSQSNAARRYLKYFMHHINLLRHYKVIPVVVFDGGNMPCKAATENVRHRRRETNLALAKEKLKEGNVSAAVECFQKAIQITPSMAHQLIQILRSENIDFLVAPYEADAQLAYMSTLDADQGGIAAVITEDSDLIAYGCPAIIFKMDRYGNGEEIIMDKVFSVVSDGLSFKNFDNHLFTGTKRAYSLVLKYKNLDRVLSTLKLDKRYRVPEDYSDSFRKALAVFHHARVYDAETKSIRHLKPLEHEHLQCLNGELDMLGPELPPSIAAGIAEGRLNPITMEAFDQFPIAESCIYYVGIPSSDRSERHDSYTMSAEESSITISLSQPRKEEIIVIEEIDCQKYMKEAVALSKLVVPQSSQLMEKEAEHNEVPDNNPFKKRKLENKSEIQNISQSISVLENEELSIISCPLLSQESVDSKLRTKVLVGKEKILKKSTTKTDRRNLNERTGILKFFKHL